MVCVGMCLTDILQIPTGDLDNPLKDPPIVMEVLNDIQSRDKLAFCNVNFLLASSGGGKTKCCNDIAKKRFAIFMDGNGGVRGQQDIQEMLENIGNLASSYKYPLGVKIYQITKAVGDNKHDQLAFMQEQKIFEESCEYEVFLTFAARVIAMMLYLSTGRMTTPRQWRDVQLNGIFGSHYMRFMKLIRRNIRKTHSLSQLKEITKIMLLLHLSKTGERLLVIVDEAQFYITKYENMFVSTDTIVSNYTTFQIPDKSLWTKFAATISSLYSIALIIASTSIRMRDHRLIWSATAKIGVDAGQRLNTRTNFRFNNQQETMQLINRIFTTNLDSDTRNRICLLIPGRSRYITTYAEILDSSHKSPLETLLYYVSELKNRSDVTWSIYSGIDLIFRTYPKHASQELCKLVKCYKLEHGIIQEPEQQNIDWLIGGVTHVAVTNSSSIVYKMDEVMIYYVCIYISHFTFIHSILQTIVLDSLCSALCRKQVSLANYLCREMAMLKDEDSRGVLFDHFVIASQMDRVHKISFWEDISMNINENNKIFGVDQQLTFEEYLSHTSSELIVCFCGVL